MKGEGSDWGTVEDLKISKAFQNKFKIIGSIFAKEKHFLMEKHTCQFSYRKCIHAYTHIKSKE